MREGGVILYPTDTIWGIGCDATNEDAVRRVYEIKQRQDSKAMLVLVDSSVKVDFYVRDVPEVAWDLIDLADKPLTIIYSGARNLAANLLAEDGSVGIRVTNEDFSKRLCQQFRKAIVSTSVVRNVLQRFSILIIVVSIKLLLYYSIFKFSVGLLVAAR